MRVLLVLRPAPGTGATVARAVALGLEAVAAPLFTLVPLAWEAPHPAAHDALMLTSANAVRHAGAALGRYDALPVYAVGAATAEAARAAGLTVLHAGDADASALLRRMAGDGVRGPLRLAGRDHRADAFPGVTVTTRLVYAAHAAAALPAEAAAAIERGAVALLHSPRAARLFGGLLEAADMPRSRVSVAAISATAAAAAGEGWRARAIAARPDDAALLAAAARLCEEA